MYVYSRNYCRYTHSQLIQRMKQNQRQLFLQILSAWKIVEISGHNSYWNE